MSTDPVIAEVLSFALTGDTARTVLRFNCLPSKPIAPASLYSLGERREEVFQLHKVVRTQRKRVAFETYQVADPTLKPGGTYRFETWFFAPNMEAVTDVRRAWRKETFTGCDAVVERTKPTLILSRATQADRDRGAEIRPGGWDHEHCEVCFATISGQEPGGCVAYTDGTDWLCVRCYDRFIASGLGPRLR